MSGPLSLSDALSQAAMAAANQPAVAPTPTPMPKSKGVYPRKGVAADYAGWRRPAACRKVFPAEPQRKPMHFNREIADYTLGLRDREGDEDLDLVIQHQSGLPCFSFRFTLKDLMDHRTVAKEVDGLCRQTGRTLSFHCLDSEKSWMGILKKVGLNKIIKGRK